jgi:hypothetical protein
MVASLIYLAAALAPSPRSKFHLLNIISTVLTPICLFTTIFTTAFASSINSQRSGKTTAGTLQTWTCRWTDFRNEAPEGFGKICTESMVAFNLVIFILVLEIIVVATTGCGWWIEMKLKRATVGGVMKLEGGSP